MKSAKTMPMASSYAMFGRPSAELEWWEKEQLKEAKRLAAEVSKSTTIKYYPRFRGSHKTKARNRSGEVQLIREDIISIAKESRENCLNATLPRVSAAEESPLPYSLQLLAAGMLHRALLDLGEHIPRSVKRDALLWLTEQPTGDDSHPFLSAVWCCYALRLDSDFFRERVITWLRSQKQAQKEAVSSPA